MFPAIQSALSGLSAHSAKIHSNANNIANAGTEGFKKSRVILSAAEPQGVIARSEQVEASGPMMVVASGNGMELIEQSNVDIGRELPELSLNSRCYEANLKTLQAADEMLGGLLRIKA